MKMEYSVKMEGFEGPLELLLELIEKRKLAITDVSLTEVADEYMEHIKELDQFPTAEAASFLFIASTLVLIKSKALLPLLELTEEETGSIDDLERRLKLYKQIKELSVNVSNRFGKEVMFPVGTGSNIDPVFSPHDGITLAGIGEAVVRVVGRFPKKIITPEVIVRKVVSLDEMITRLVDRVQKSINMSFSQFSEHGDSNALPKEKRLNLIVGFLAMLELVKQGMIAVQQDSIFDDIKMESSNDELSGTN